ncbi:nbl1 borealin protein [Fusarium austroafricanum]|uniref:Nbl1 borealin protein n=1 Tax=Fusarium austroafricanum TaxID=2364996 RepID=A0A8H4KI37_9HYPO|nr:nbl1 borealin protein [Fusarium austroafricanum]
MAPVRSRKRNSDQHPESPLKKSMMERVPLHSGSDASQPRSPIRKRTPGTITMVQKQAMIDNMQLEITERARRLRAQYNYMATTVRSRIEMRLNRVPMSMRNVKMGDLLQKYLDQEQQRAAKSAAQRKPPTTRGASPPKQIQTTAHSLKPAARTQKRISDAISGDKENEVEHNEMAKKRARAATTTDVSHSRPGQILSPTSSNSRMANRPVSPVKSAIARPASPLKRPATASGMLSSMVEKAKATRAGVTRNTTANSNIISSSTNSTAATRNKKAPAPTTTTSRAPTSRPGTRTTRRSIANSESSESSNGTVIRKGAAAKSAPVRKGTTTSRKGTTGAVRKTTTKTNSSTASTGTGRTLRKRA